MNRSETIKNIAAALAKFQGEVENPKTVADNPFFKSKYAPLDEVLKVIKPILQKNGLSFIQSCGGDGQTVSVTTTLMHESGEWIESDALVMKPVKNDPQGVGSAITYARRYTISALLGIASEDDDDANSASYAGNKPKQNSKPAAAPALVNSGTKKQIETLCKELADLKGGDYQTLIDYYLKICKVPKLDDLPQETAMQVIAQMSKHINNEKAGGKQ